MEFVEDDHMIERVATAGANKPLTVAILPWAMEACSLGLNPDALDRRDYLFIEIRPTIKDQVLRRGVIGKNLEDLLRHPCARRVLRPIEVKYASPVMSDDEGAAQHIEGKRRHGKKIYGGDCLAGIAEECCPSLCGLRNSGSSSHPARHDSLRDFKTSILRPP